MNIIVGLGNPGAQYKYSRHNIGFQVLDNFAIRNVSNSLKWKKKFLAHIIYHRFHGQEIILVKPQTFMNLSGRSIKEITAYYNIHHNQLLIIYDDFHLPLGNIRIRKRGSSGGHHGMESIINSLKSEDIPRLRIGIRNDKLLENLDYSDFVLSNFLPEEKDLVENTIVHAVQAVEDILNKDYEFAMREYNRLDIKN